MNDKRLKALGAVLTLVAVAVIGGLVGVSRIKSPADVAARTAAPEPSPILVPVEHRVLSSKIVTRGTARFGLPQPISIAPSLLKGQPGLITTLPLRNAQLGEGSVMLTASGRPVRVLRGQIPAYRDLTPGVAGDDVRQLQQALERLGFHPGPAGGAFDEPTGAAVAAWYRSAGWDPFGPTSEQTALVRALERDAAEAERARSAATAGMAVAALGVESARATADHGNRVADSELAAAMVERARIVLDPRQTETARAAGEAGLARAEAGVKAARLAGELAVQAALDAQKVAGIDARLASDRATRLAADLDAAQQKLGIQVPVDEIVFLPDLPVRVQDLSAVVGDAARGPVMTVTDNQLAIDSSVPLQAAALLKPGMTVSIDEQALGIKAAGVVSAVANGPGTHGVDGYHIYFEVRVSGTSMPLQGLSVRLTIPIKTSAGPVLAVPVSALTLAADGTSRVQVDDHGVLETIVVQPGLAADGFVEVTPVRGTLTPGQLVVVGYENPARPGAR